ncbi:MAG: DUF111 family protein, partial [Chloroflexi bacterium]|nr:DUF111 family protein [Chloroflexota bacterium]
GALIDCGIDIDAIRTGIASLELPGVELTARTVIKGGFRATSIQITHPEQHAHRHRSGQAKESEPQDQTFAGHHQVQHNDQDTQSGHRQLGRY